MKVVISRNKKDSGRAAAEQGAELIRRALKKNGVANIIVATGASQFDVLANLIKQPNVAWNNVTAFHLDEYVGTPITHGASFRKYLWERFVSQLPLPLAAFHYVNAEQNPQAECDRLGKIIAKNPIDVAFIGIGENGHVAFNDPPADFQTNKPYLVVELDEACRKQQLGEGWFPSLKAVPRRAISMSPRQIMKSAAIVCTVPDERKANAVRNSLEGEITPNVPASILQRHKNCTLFLDRASASLLSRSGA
ncbi:MAG: glucosamine-6-phosphate deaminase [Phycisphaerales bacterium]|jgi:glucosamine-6-phosphate deaminase|nr:glucosamine-6-phosphate deaminase [Phycisphaerales bacterium]